MSYADDLLRRQNADGGWSYSRGSSWTEPTCYALLGLRAAGASAAPEMDRGAAWLARCQRTDGGFAPRESVRESTWLAALALLLPDDLQKHFDARKAARWLIAQSGRESGWVFRLRLFLVGTPVEQSLAFDGWPWYPDAAAWIIPTALSVLALEKLSRTMQGAPDGNLDKTTGDKTIAARAGHGRDFLLARRCRDEGWNHGSTRALGYDSDSYPETTGLALLALRASNRGTAKARSVDPAFDQKVQHGTARAEALLADCQSNEAASWLALGLSAHGRMLTIPPLPARRTTMELALSALAGAALQGNNLFLS